MEGVELTANKSSQRSKNFKETEVSLLLDLVKTYKDIVECKKTDQVSIREKDRVWSIIALQFNKSSGVYHREVKILKNKYENLKKVSKRKFAEERKYVFGTGGGPNIKSDLTETDFKIKEVMGDLPVLGEESHFDSDSYQPRPSSSGHKDESMFTETIGLINISHLPVVMSEVGLMNEEAITPPPPMQPKPTSSGILMYSPLKTTPKFMENDDDFGETTKILSSSFNVKDLRNKTSSPLAIRTKKRMLDKTLAGKKIEVLSKSKTELIELQKKLVEKQIAFLEEEHKLKMKLMQEEHDLKSQILKYQIEAFKKPM